MEIERKIKLDEIDLKEVLGLLVDAIRIDSTVGVTTAEKKTLEVHAKEAVERIAQKAFLAGVNVGKNFVEAMSEDEKHWRNQR